MAEYTLYSISHFYPEITLIITLCAAVIGDILLKEKNHHISWILIAGFSITGMLVMMQNGTNVSVFYDMVAVDPYASFVKIILIITALFIVFFSMNCQELQQNANRIGEYYMLISGMVLGMFLMASATNILLMYLAFEMTSISSYVLAGFIKKSNQSAEASMKYIIFGAASSGILIYGLSLLVGITGATSIYEINQALAGGTDHGAILLVSGLMIITGLGFKVAIVPFHFWAPDVYEGAPITITAFLAVASKIAAFAMMVRFFKIGLTDDIILQDSGVWTAIHGFDWNLILAVLAGLTMIFGNIAALWQDNIKRLLAYSSIAHAGYILMGLVVLTNEGIMAILIYMCIYMFMNLGAFYVAMLFQNKLQTSSIEDYKGLGQRAVFPAVALTIFLISLAGIPPTAGFIAKLYIFGSVISAGWIWLVAIAGVTTIISLFYYIRIVRNMFFYEPQNDSTKLIFSRPALTILVLLLIPTLLIGIYFSPIVRLAKEAVVMFGM